MLTSLRHRASWADLQPIPIILPENWGAHMFVGSNFGAKQTLGDAIYALIAQNDLLENALSTRNGCGW